MKTIFVWLFAAFLSLPVHTLSYVATVLHLFQPDHDHDHDHHHGSEAAQSEADRDLTHRHGPDQPIHSHSKDMWGLSSCSGISQTPSLVFDVPDSIVFDQYFVVLKAFYSDPFFSSLLRPPIA